MKYQRKNLTKVSVEITDILCGENSVIFTHSIEYEDMENRRKDMKEEKL